MIRMDLPYSFFLLPISLVTLCLQKKTYPISYFILSYLKIILQCIFSGIFLLKVDGNDMKVKKRGTTLTFFLIKLTEMTKMYNEDKLKIPIRKKF